MISEPLGFVDARTAVERLSDAQLQAYNRADIDAFCDCYHDDIEVLDATGNRTLSGIEAFRARYAAMFDAHQDVHARIDARLQLGAHVVEREQWSRTHKQTGARSEGQVLVRYTEQDGKIRYAQFLAE